MTILHALLCAVFLGQQAAPPAVSLERLAEEMLAALRAKDTERVLAFYGGGPDFVHVDNGRPVTWSQLETGIRQFLSTVRVNDLRWEGRPRVLMLNETTAVIHGWHQASGIAADGTPLKTHTGYWSGVVRKSGAGWRIVHSHSSDSAPH